MRWLGADAIFLKTALKLRRLHILQVLACGLAFFEIAPEEEELLAEGGEGLGVGAEAGGLVMPVS